MFLDITSWKKIKKKYEAFLLWAIRQDSTWFPYFNKMEKLQSGVDRQERQINTI